MYVKVKVTIGGYESEPCILCPHHISFTHERIFISLKLNFLLTETVTEPIIQPCRPKVKIIVEGHEFKPCVSCLVHISFISESIVVKLQSNILLTEMVYGTHNSTMLTQGQGDKRMS